MDRAPILLSEEVGLLAVAGETTLKYPATFLLFPINGTSLVKLLPLSSRYIGLSMVAVGDPSLISSEDFSPLVKGAVDVIKGKLKPYLSIFLRDRWLPVHYVPTVAIAPKT